MSAQPKAQPRCIGCSDLLSKANNSEAHIIPNALGGRLAPTNLICRTCNNILDRAVDNALVKAFDGFPTMIDLPRQRGKNPPVILKTASGKRVKMDPDGTLTVADVSYNVRDEGEKRIVSISAPTPKLARQLLARAKKENPGANIDVENAVLKSVAGGVPSDDQLIANLDYSPKAVFGGVMAALWLFISYKEKHSLDNLTNALKRLQGIHDHGGMFRYLPEGCPGLKGPNIDFPNKIIVRTVPSTGELIGYVELLGTLKIGGIYASTKNIPSDLVEHIYVHDPFAIQDKSSEFHIDANTFERIDWRTVGLGPVKQDMDDLSAAMLSAGARLSSKYYSRAASIQPAQTTHSSPSSIADEGA